MFECHITVSTKDADEAANIAQKVHWKTSEIARDPVLGNDTYFYLTTHANDYSMMWTRLRNTVLLLEEANVSVIREKIELIVHDTKVKV